MVLKNISIKNKKNIVLKLLVLKNWKKNCVKKYKKNYVFKKFYKLGVKNTKNLC